MEEVAIITGASSGIGAATAVVFAKHGCKLALSGRNVEKLQVTKKYCIDAGLTENDVIAVQADMTKESDLIKLVDETIAKFGKLSILINNAGISITKSGGPSSAPLTEFDEIFNTNVRGLMRITQLCVPHLKITKGNIVNNSSMLSKATCPEATYYCMSKAAVDAYTRNLAVELGTFGIRVNSINPGVTASNIWFSDGVGMPVENWTKHQEACSKFTPLGRTAEAEEMGNIMWMLASREASFLTGQSLVVDGGLTVAPVLKI